MDKLALTNVDRYIELPMIAVMGDTSSGKSSLLSFISMVELPSSDELTTRCPIMLQMRRAEAGTATVDVKWKDRPTGKADAEISFKTKSVTESNWDLLTSYIAEAQNHIVEVTGKEVARDVVSVKISGPNFEDLTLTDLPGIVRSTGVGESETLAEDIQGLIDDYLKNSRCVILAVHPANVDFHNSQIMADAKKVDPETKRTLPVLTKPDIVDGGAERSVLDLLHGRKTDAFTRGFHMVKGRGQASLNKGDSIEKGLRDEEAFFRNTQPWRDVNDRSLLGTEELRRKLGDLQMELVRLSLPSIVKEMKAEKATASKELDVLGTFPGSVSEKRQFFDEAKDRFVRGVKALIRGSNLRDCNWKVEKVTSAMLHQKCEAFKSALHQGRLSGISAIHEGDKVIARI